jgi:Ion channel
MEPIGAVGRIEQDLADRGLVDPDAEGDGIYDRYLLALALLLVTVIAFAFSGSEPLGRLVSVLVEAVTLLVILRSSRVPRRILVPASIVVGLAVVAAVTAVVIGDPADSHAPVIVGAVLAVVGPPAIIHRLLSHHRIDLTTIAGALCVYLLAGIFFAYVFGMIAEFDDTPFFAQQEVADGVDFVYFSFVTIATLGYGDLTPRGDLGRMLAATEAVLGQLYLVSAVALLVGNLGRRRDDPPPPASERDPHPSA